MPHGQSHLKTPVNKKHVALFIWGHIVIIKKYGEESDILRQNSGDGYFAWSEKQNPLTPTILGMT